MNRDGEGATIQLIWSPVGEKYVKRYKGALDKILKGTPLKEAIDIPGSVGEKFYILLKMFLVLQKERRKR